MSYKLTVLWGSDACYILDEFSGDLNKYRRYVRMFGNSVGFEEPEEKEFNTKEERDAYIEGVQSAEGWMNYHLELDEN